MVYLTCGQLNLHKSDICTGDIVRYLHDLSKTYRLTEFGSVKGMDHYGVISKPAREKQLLKIKEFVACKSFPLKIPLPFFRKRNSILSI